MNKLNLIYMCTTRPVPTFHFADYGKKWQRQKGIFIILFQTIN